MAHRTNPRFWQMYAALPPDVRRQANKQFKLLKTSPQHPSLQLKRIGGRDGVWSVRVTQDYRAVAIEVEVGLQWFWIGTHAEYIRIIR